MPGTNDYNRVYESLVKDDKDIVGMLAYSIYKKQKQETIKEFIISNNGTRPSATDLESFHNFATQRTQLEIYRKQATGITQGLANSLLKAKQKDIKEIIDRHLSKSKGFWSYMYGVSQSLVANFLWLIIFILFSVYLWSLEHGPFETLKSIIEKSGQK
jgi:hypothetical protein